MKLQIEWIVRFLLAVILWASCVIITHAEVPVAGVTLSIDSAIKRAIQTQLTTQLAHAASQEARGRAIQAAAFLLPQVTGSVSQQRVFKSNLAAQGFNFPSVLPNPVIGPYNVFDARFELVQKLLDVQSIWNTKAANANVRAARFEEDLAAEQVALAAALSYIEDLRALHAVEDAKTNWDLSQRLSTLAHHQHDAGLANGVDVARAETHVAQDHQIFIQAQLAATQADIRLKRVVGLPFSETVTLADSSTLSGLENPAEAAALAQAGRDRTELQIADQLLKAETYGLSSARAGYLPTASAKADYGFSGNLPSGSARTGSIGARLDLPIFSGGATYGQTEEAQAQKAAAQSRYDDIHLQVEEDVRLALHTLSAETDEVSASETEVQLAERELQLAQDRYSAGVGDNIQVVTAQASLEDARKTRVDARARYSDARANLAMSLGHMRTFYL